MNAKEQVNRVKEQHEEEARRRAELELVVKAHRRAAKVCRMMKLMILAKALGSI